MKNKSFAVFGVLVIAACGGEVAIDGELGDERESTIANGKIDRNHPAVGKIATAKGSGHCTGTLIRSNVVLTSAHCVYFGKYYKQRMNMSFIVGGKRYSGWARQPSVYGGADIALLHLRKPVLNIKPRKICTRAPRRGQKITVVGYGRESATGTYGRKRFGTNNISRVKSHYFESDGFGGSKAQTCFGDSGGPAFSGGCIAGVAWFGREPYCKATMGHKRADVYATWLNDWADRHCQNDILDTHLGETDVDCGGPCSQQTMAGSKSYFLACRPGKRCKKSSDCYSRNATPKCISGICHECDTYGNRFQLSGGCATGKIATISAGPDRLYLGCTDDEGRRRSSQIMVDWYGFFTKGGGCPTGSRVTNITANNTNKLTVRCVDDDRRSHTGSISLGVDWVRANGGCPSGSTLSNVRGTLNGLMLDCTDDEGRRRSGKITFTNAEVCTK